MVQLTRDQLKEAGRKKLEQYRQQKFKKGENSGQQSPTSRSSQVSDFQKQKFGEHLQNGISSELQQQYLGSQNIPQQLQTIHKPPAYPFKDTPSPQNKISQNMPNDYPSLSSPQRVQDGSLGGQTNLSRKNTNSYYETPYQITETSNTPDLDTGQNSVRTSNTNQGAIHNEYSNINDPQSLNFTLSQSSTDGNQNIYQDTDAQKFFAQDFLVEETYQQDTVTKERQQDNNNLPNFNIQGNIQDKYQNNTFRVHQQQPYENSLETYQLQTLKDRDSKPNTNKDAQQLNVLQSMNQPETSSTQQYSPQQFQNNENTSFNQQQLQQQELINQANINAIELAKSGDNSGINEQQANLKQEASQNGTQIDTNKKGGFKFWNAPYLQGLQRKLRFSSDDQQYFSTQNSQTQSQQDLSRLSERQQAQQAQDSQTKQIQTKSQALSSQAQTTLGDSVITYSQIQSAVATQPESLNNNSNKILQNDPLDNTYNQDSKTSNFYDQQDYLFTDNAQQQQESNSFTQNNQNQKQYLDTKQQMPKVQNEQPKQYIQQAEDNNYHTQQQCFQKNDQLGMLQQPQDELQQSQFKSTQEPYDFYNLTQNNFEHINQKQSDNQNNPQSNNERNAQSQNFKEQQQDQLHTYKEFQSQKIPQDENQIISQDLKNFENDTQTLDNEYEIQDSGFRQYPEQLQQQEQQSQQGQEQQLQQGQEQQLQQGQEQQLQQDSKQQQDNNLYQGNHQNQQYSRIQDMMRIMEGHNDQSLGIGTNTDATNSKSLYTSGKSSPVQQTQQYELQNQRQSSPDFEAKKSNHTAYFQKKDSIEEGQIQDIQEQQATNNYSTTSPTQDFFSNTEKDLLKGILGDELKNIQTFQSKIRPKKNTNLHESLQNKPKLQRQISRSQNNLYDINQQSSNKSKENGSFPNLYRQDQSSNNDLKSQNGFSQNFAKSNYGNTKYQQEQFKVLQKYIEQLEQDNFNLTRGLEKQFQLTQQIERENQTIDEKYNFQAVKIEDLQRQLEIQQQYVDIQEEKYLQELKEKDQLQRQYNEIEQREKSLAEEVIHLEQQVADFRSRALLSEEQLNSMNEDVQNFKYQDQRYKNEIQKLRLHQSQMAPYIDWGSYYSKNKGSSNIEQHNENQFNNDKEIQCNISESMGKSQLNTKDQLQQTDLQLYQLQDLFTAPQDKEQQHLSAYDKQSFQYDNYLSSQTGFQKWHQNFNQDELFQKYINVQFRGDLVQIDDLKQFLPKIVYQNGIQSFSSQIVQDVIDIQNDIQLQAKQVEEKLNTKDTQLNQKEVEIQQIRIINQDLMDKYDKLQRQIDKLVDKKILKRHGIQLQQVSK